MKKEITAEMYSYNKFPGPSFNRYGSSVTSEGISLELLENHKDAFDAVAFGQRFSQIMLKFDYIVGDWGNEQLRLKGFYKDDREVPNAMKISRLQDYLLEYCNYGCAYFVLENPAPQDLPVEKDEGRGRNKRKRRQKQNSRSSASNYQKERKAIIQQGDRLGNRRTPSKKARHFNLKNDGKKEGERTIRREIQETKHSFVIRQK